MQHPFEYSPQEGLYIFRCDDASGFHLCINQAVDGDFHLAIMEDPHADERNRGAFRSVRIRSPMIGGGSHDALYDGISGAISALHGHHGPLQSKIKDLERIINTAAKHGDIAYDQQTWEDQRALDVLLNSMEQEAGDCDADDDADIKEAEAAEPTDTERACGFPCTLCGARNFADAGNHCSGTEYCPSDIIHKMNREKGV